MTWARQTWMHGENKYKCILHKDACILSWLLVPFWFFVIFLQINLNIPSQKWKSLLWLTMGYDVNKLESLNTGECWYINSTYSNLCCFLGDSKRIFLYIPISYTYVYSHFLYIPIYDPCSGPTLAPETESTIKPGSALHEDACLY